jgi:hypothetical protein
MDALMAAGFAAVIACLLAITILVFASRGIIERTHRKNLAGQKQEEHVAEEKRDRGDAG